MATVLLVLLAVVVALLVVLVAGLLRSHAEILRALHGLGVDLDPDNVNVAPVTSMSIARGDGSSRQASDIAGVTPDGDAASFAVVGAANPTMLAFLTSGCSSCANFWSAFADPHLTVPGGARLIAVTKGPEAESPARLRKFASSEVPVVMASAAWEAYDVPVAPYFAFVDGATGVVVGEGAANTWEHVVSMCKQAIADAGLAPAGRRRKRLDGAAREERVDATLRRAGIDAGHPSLYPSEVTELRAGE